MKVDLYDASNAAIADLVNASQEVYGSYSYATGYMQSLLQSCIVGMKKKDAVAVIKRLEIAAETIRQRKDETQRHQDY